MKEKLAMGGEFLLTDAVNYHVFSPEDFSSEQRQIAETTEEFMRKEVLPDLDRIESQDFDLVLEKMRACADLGLFLVDIPEDFGGLELDKATSMLLAEKMAPAGSFSITYCGQTGIGSLPLVYYGTIPQKEQYLGKLTSGEWIGAYCLTEPDCGSDPLSARATAVLTEDGRHYILNGVKQFITNAAFADLFTVFAKIDGKLFSSFLVERSFEGVSVGPEEQKMGLKGSSTAQVLLQDVRVPVENLLGEAGKGHKIAFNVLNIGRLKLAATTTGVAKSAFAEASAYAGERKQFGRPIGDFGAIREKLADLAAATFASESVVYRVAGLLDDRIASLDRSAADYLDQYQKAIEEYAGECAIAKVFCSEVLAHVVDEVLQIHGGYGYIRDYPAERYYRDERINRIFEGTNEINRILIPTLLLRRAESGRLDLRGKVEEAKARAGAEKVQEVGGKPFDLEFSVLANLKQLFLVILGEVSKAGEAQELMLALADMAIGIFALESTVMRARKVYQAASDEKKDLLEAVVKVTTFERAGRFYLAAIRCGAYALKEDSLKPLQQEIARLSAYPAGGLLEAKQLLAETSTKSGKYIF
ncbi:acyl-CoA dehydrogenase family protein [Desulfuromonas sp. TF]|uniref:acyl-CoA dehydrogenase family protein n=1 Tax=Desulfuromonas sp. TF TaxID=1232410 RepID=UPI0004298FB6|nr:acyl-CoA dehydrogenase family protein [Desulfuromonas sp. TF]